MEVPASIVVQPIATSSLARPALTRFFAGLLNVPSAGLQCTRLKSWLKMLDEETMDSGQQVSMNVLEMSNVRLSTWFF